MYVGIGVDPTMIGFGTMIQQCAHGAGAHGGGWSLVAAFAFMFSLVLAANLLPMRPRRL